MNKFNLIDIVIIQKGIYLAKRKIEDNYSDKFIYAIPDWAILTGNPEPICLVYVYGNEGILVTKQRVDFKVDFNNENSIIYYANFLNNQMNIHLPLLGYIFFYKSILIAKKDPNYPLVLSDFELAEIIRHNTIDTTTDFDFIIFTKDFKIVTDCEDLKN